MHLCLSRYLFIVLFVLTCSYLTYHVDPSANKTHIILGKKWLNNNVPGYFLFGRCLMTPHWKYRSAYKWRIHFLFGLWSGRDSSHQKALKPFPATSRQWPRLPGLRNPYLHWENAATALSVNKRVLPCDRRTGQCSRVIRERGSAPVWSVRSFSVSGDASPRVSKHRLRFLCDQ